MRAEDFSCCLDVLYGDLGISKLQFLIFDFASKCIRGVLGNKCAGQHNLKTVQITEIIWK
jgi:hypothetical protein